MKNARGKKSQAPNSAEPTYNTDHDPQSSSTSKASGSPTIDPLSGNLGLKSSSTTNSQRLKSISKPPITKQQLRQLDLYRIFHNPKLRHNINFDPDLQFKPILEREQRQSQTEEFRETMRSQLQEYLLRRDQFERGLDGAEWSLPATLKVIRDILETLVPQRDRSLIEETFDVDFLMQQFRNGVANLGKLTHWFPHLLKRHCAPIRDAWIHDTSEQLCKGGRDWNVELIVLGVHNLLYVLEAAKLDVANHQIRCLQPLLIEDTVPFEQKFFMEEIAMRRVDITQARTWFKRAATLLDATHPEIQSKGKTWEFMKALVILTLPFGSPEKVPDTFFFDEERITKLRTGMLDLINLQVCIYLYRSPELQSRQEEPTYLQHENTPSISFLSPPMDQGVLSTQTLPSEHNFTRALSMPLSRQPTSKLRSSLQAILASSKAPGRWAALAPSFALEILRLRPLSLPYLPQLESELAFHLSNPWSRLYQKAEHDILMQVLPFLPDLVRTYTSLSQLPAI